MRPHARQTQRFLLSIPLLLQTHSQALTGAILDSMGFKPIARASPTRQACIAHIQKQRRTLQLQEKCQHGWRTSHEVATNFAASVILLQIGALGAMLAWQQYWHPKSVHVQHRPWLDMPQQMLQCRTRPAQRPKPRCIARTIHFKNCRVTGFMVSHLFLCTQRSHTLTPTTTSRASRHKWPRITSHQLVYSA